MLLGWVLGMYCPTFYAGQSEPIATAWARSRIEVAVANTLVPVGEADPSKITIKIKHHILVHAWDDIKRLGALIGMIAGGHGPFNSVFRVCSVLSNLQSPSRDVALPLA